MIEDLLRNGPMLALAVETALSKARIFERTRKRAKAEAGVGSQRDGNAWYWTPAGYTDDQWAVWIDAKKSAEKSI